MNNDALALIVEGLAETKVGDLRGELGVEQNVASSEIAVHETLGRQVPSRRVSSSGIGGE